MNNEKSSWRNPALFLALCAYTLTIVVWSVRQEGKINQLEAEYATLNQRVYDLDLRGSRNIPALEAKIDELNRLINRHLTKPN